MGLTDMISKTLKGGKKTSPSLTKKTSPSLTSKSKTAVSMTSQVNRVIPVRPSQRIPTSWNKDNWHCVDIEDNGKSYTGYLWSTGNWIEIHIFDSMDIKKGIPFYDNNKGFYVESYIIQHGNRGHYVAEGHAWVNMIACPYFPVYKHHKKSAIMSCDNVNYTKSHKHHGGKYEPDNWIEGTIKVSISSADIKRWHEWHPDNVFMTELQYKTGYDYKEDRSNVISDRNVAERTCKEESKKFRANQKLEEKRAKQDSNAYVYEPNSRPGDPQWEAWESKHRR